ncbi:arrestin homolog [Daphnia carinata]|uniref:arrestin homolog n=1 Tax=Daphnia carinata TaxID=120202 RepID=UPI0025798B91|nr:arrestin homolog [Daphnia carinata]
MVASVKVFKKTSPNAKLTVYLGKRDFVDHQDHVDPIEGVVVADNDYLKGRKVFCQVIVTIRYGREQDEVMGLKFVKELVLINEQVVPPRRSQDKKLCPLQDRLLKKLGSNAYAFTFTLPTTAPASIVLQEGGRDGDTAPPVGVEYDFLTFVGENENDRSHKRSSVSMAIRKVQYAPLTPSSKQPSTMVSKGFTFSSGKLNLQLTLDRELFYHNEQIRFNVNVKNESKKTVKGIMVAVVQNVEITLINGHYNKRVASLETREGCPITPGSSMSKTFALTPMMNGNKDVRGIALDGHLKDDEVNLASSTIIAECNEATGFVVSYVARVKLDLGSMGGELVADVPFKLMHPAPGSAMHQGKGKLTKADSQQGRHDSNYARDDDDENIVFEDFARLRST